MWITAGTISVLLIIAWVIGRIHIALIDRHEVGKLTQAWFTQRVIIYVGALGAIFAFPNTHNAFLAGFGTRTPTPFSLLLFCSIVLAGVIVSFSYLETFWYHAKHTSKAVRRRKIFELVFLPILYSSLYLYWVTLLPGWAIILWRAKDLSE